jgi:hypothetical protein
MDYEVVWEGGQVGSHTIHELLSEDEFKLNGLL